MLDENRFQVSKATLLADSFMTQFIRVGGIGIILAVFGIFLFILLEVLPLFRKASIEPVAEIETAFQDVAFIGTDDWSEMPVVGLKNGTFALVPLSVTRNKDGLVESAQLAESGIKLVKPELPAGSRVTAVAFKPTKGQALLGLSGGQAAVVDISYKPEFAPDGSRSIKGEIKTSRTFSFGKATGDVVEIDYYSTDSRGTAVGILEDETGRHVHVATFTRKSSLFGAGEWRLGKTFALDAELSGKPQKALMNSLGNAILVSTNTGHVHYFHLEREGVVLRQTFRPFEKLDDPQIGTINWLLGNESVVLTSMQGDNHIYSPSVDPKTEQRIYFHTKTLKKLPAKADHYSASQRNRAYVLTSGSTISLRFSTSEDVRWQKDFPFEPASIASGNRYDTLLAVSPDGKLHLYDLNDPHPESSFAAYFGRVWYEGQPEPAFLYQSSAAGAEAEPKISMVNLIWGSLKGTIFALLFAVPVALLAAIYTSQFLKPEFKKIVKPTMEVMASLPSVVLGFLGALWLAPKIENDMPSIFLIIVVIPVASMALGTAWCRMPQRYRRHIKQGYEFLIFMPLLLGLGYLCWNLGPVFESLCFVVTDAATGKEVVDFRLWWRETTGMAFDQRNSVIVGFMMGFAVIPIIFTITEDAMSNVPKFLTSASLALGASRWQTAWNIVLPTASAGIFSALMIGFGRAVGETMIVVMCSGNTPLFDLPFSNPEDGFFPNPFSGIRTLSANIAVELPEAPRGSTHYRSLYFGALLLFLMTFFVNTIAEVARNRLREKYKTVG